MNVGRWICLIGGRLRLQGHLKVIIDTQTDGAVVKARSILPVAKMSDKKTAAAGFSIKTTGPRIYRAISVKVKKNLLPRLNPDDNSEMIDT